MSDTFPDDTDGPPSYRLYKASHVVVATLFGGPLAGGILIASNERRLGRPRDAFLFVLLGSALTIALVMARFYLFANRVLWWPLTGLSLVVMWQLALHRQGNAVRAHVAAKGALASGVLAVGIGMASGVAILVVSVALAAMFWRDVTTAILRNFYGSCDMRNESFHASGDEQICIEMMGSGARDAEARATCHDKWSTSRCDRTGVIGGCRSPSVMWWYYASHKVATPRDVQLVCAVEDQKFVPRDAPPQ